MAKQYSPKTFLRQVRGSMLDRYLEKKGIEGLDLNLEIIKPAVVEELFKRLMSVAPQVLQAVESDFAAITELASSDGTNAILREAGRRGVDLSELFQYAHNDYERACWTFIEHPQIFDLAACFVAMDRFGSGRWNRRLIDEALVPNVSPEAIGKLADQMRDVYAKEGRGRHCHIDYYVRQDPDDPEHDLCRGHPAGRRGGVKSQVYPGVHFARYPCFLRCHVRWTGLGCKRLSDGSRIRVPWYELRVLPSGAASSKRSIPTRMR